MWFDPQIPPDNDSSVWGVIEYFFRGAILAAIGLVCGILWHIADASKERNWKDRLTVLIASGCAGAMAGPSAMAIASFLYKANTGNALPPDVQLAIGSVAAGLGAKILDMVSTKVACLTKVNLKDPDDIGQCREGMSPEERARHADSCVFTPDRCGGKCMRCPHRKEP